MNHYNSQVKSYNFMQFTFSITSTEISGSSLSFVAIGAPPDALPIIM